MGGYMNEAFLNWKTGVEQSRMVGCLFRWKLGHACDHAPRMWCVQGVVIFLG